MHYLLPKVSCRFHLCLISVAFPWWMQLMPELITPFPVVSRRVFCTSLCVCCHQCASATRDLFSSLTAPPHQWAAWDTPCGQTQSTALCSLQKHTVIGITLKPLFFFLFHLKKYSKKISKDLEELNTIISQLDQIYIFRTPIITAEEAFFSSIHRTFTKTEHILGHKVHHDKHKGNEIIKRMCSDHKVINLRINRNI